MRKILLLTCLAISSIANAQQHLFVEEGKTWHFIYFAPNHYLTEEHSFDSPLLEYDYAFKSETEDLIDGKSYTKMYENDNIHGYYREEAGKVYSYNANSQQEKLEYDFSLTTGDVFSAKVYGFDVKWDVEGTGSIKVNGNDYKTLQLQMQPTEEFGNESAQTTWVEGIGNPNNPESLNLPTMGGGKFILTYVTNELTGEYFPLSFTDRHMRGQQLVLGKKVEGNKEKLNYEFIKDTLHVYGTMMTGDAPNQYIYCNDDKNGVITFNIVEMQPCADCKALHEIDLYFSGFYAGYYHIGNADTPTLECQPTPDAITDLQQEKSGNSNAIFTIQGTRLTAPQKGLNIINGKKMLVR